MATQPYQLSARGSMFADLYEEMIRRYKAGDDEGCEHIARQILLYADMSDFFKANAHYILGMGTDCTVEHAEAAVDLFEHLYIVRPGSSYTGEHPPSDAEIAQQQRLLGLARENLAVVRAEEARIQADYERQFAEFRARHNREPTDQELVHAHYEAYRDPAMDEYYAEYDRRMEEIDAEAANQQAVENGNGEDLSSSSPTHPPAPSPTSPHNPN